MLTFSQGNGRLGRRDFLKIGSLGLGGLTLPQLLQAEQQNGRSRSHKAVIMIFLAGGPPHQDMFDLKMDAPLEYRGEFQPIDTCLPDVRICEHLPRLSQMMDRLVTIRSLVGSEGRHAAYQCLTGRPSQGAAPVGGWPSLGSVVSKLQGPAASGTPPFISLTPNMRSRGWADPGSAGFAGRAHAPFAPNADGESNLTLDGMSLKRLTSRRSLMQDLDAMRREADASGAVAGMNAYYQQAFEILTSSRLANALDLEQEDVRLRDRYGRGENVPAGYGDAGPLMNDYLLAARRLVEAGARVVTLSYGRWDWHGRPHGTNFENARDHLPQLDQGLSALLEDLSDRGMQEDVSVVVWGEFGRTPKINKNGGRDHWPRVGCALLAGGGMRTGQVIGATNDLGEHPTERPVHFQEVFATLYHNLGIDVHHTTINDLSGRPQFLVDHDRYHPLPEVV